ncbi:MAG: hypothetical protein ABW061_20445 [Polyangiaceae bacterium]
MEGCQDDDGPPQATGVGDGSAGEATGGQGTAGQGAAGKGTAGEGAAGEGSAGEGPTVVVCGANQRLCDDACVDLKVDAANCGACGEQCSAGQVCSAGECSSTCGAPTTLCAPDGQPKFCANLTSDGQNCGECGTVCAAGTVCSHGACAVSCAGSQLDCDGVCINPSSDREHCGATSACGLNGVGSPGTACAAGMVCANGTCSVSCPAAQLDCNGTCVDPASDPSHCGATAGCGVNEVGSKGSACAAGKVCSSGACSVSCPAGQLNCDGSCINPSSDRSYCGATAGCGVNEVGSRGSACAAGSVCASGTCAVSCPAGQLNCDGSCINPNSDRSYCGATAGCGVNNVGTKGSTCAVGSVCADGACAVSCPAGQLNCGGSCVNPASDPGYCGATAGCGVNSVGTKGSTCAAGSVCASGTCAVSCPAGQLNCDGSCINPNSDRSYCGATAGCGLNSVGSKGTACAVGTRCEGGTCAVSCPGTQLNCGGACIDPATDSAHCGATAGCGANSVGSKGTACAAGTVCAAGSCEADCGASLLECNNSCVDTKNDPDHCGSCDEQCDLPHGMNVCNSGTCALLGCDAGYNQCPPFYFELPITACADFSNDLENCGYCGHVCAAAHATPTCSANTCGYSTCDAGYLDCNLDASDGCETAGAACPTPKTVFITSTTFSSNMGGYAGADALCAAAAGDASLSGTFLAWVSDGSVTPASRFTQSTVPYALVDGTIVANNWAGLTSGNLRHAINLTESGGSPPAAQIGGVCNVWTGTSTSGNSQNGNCSSWTGSGTGSAGNSTLANGVWSSQCSGGICGFSAALYCFQQ